MKIIPVLDLMNGLVVHAVKGQRERYRPVQSVLTPSADPVEVARALQEETGCQAMYIADLDAIQGQGHNLEGIDKIASELAVELWVDAGVFEMEAANRLFSAGAGLVIIGSETLPDLPRLRSLVDSPAGNRFIFSLDMTGGRVISRAEFLKDLEPLEALAILTAQGLDRLILLTLDAVGAGGGPDLSVLEKAKSAFPHHGFIAGGGVKTPEHLQALTALGIDGVLVATSLHRGWITGRDIAALV